MIPSYMKIKKALEQQIASGELEIGARIASEPELAAQYGVSRETVRTALKAMEREGKLRVRVGVGRFVNKPAESIPSHIDRLSSTSEMIAAYGLKEGESKLSIRTEPSEEEWASFLNIQPKELVTILERFITADQEPVSFNINILPYKLVGEVFRIHLMKGSLMQFLDEKVNIRIGYSHTEIIVPSDSDSYANKLKIYPESTVLLLKQIHYDDTNRPVLFSYDYFRNDIFKFWIQRSREPFRHI